MTSTDTNPPAAAKPKTQPTGTRYFVLEEQNFDGNTAWVGIASVRADNGAAAIREAIAGDGDAAGTYVAVPERSFQPVRVKVETVQRIKLEDA